jgi:hypothetical protein
MRHLVIHRVLLDWPGRRTVIEGAAGQITPVHGAGRIHHFYYASLQLLIVPGLTNRLTAGAGNFRPDGFLLCRPDNRASDRTTGYPTGQLARPSARFLGAVS